MTSFYDKIELQGTEHFFDFIIHYNKFFWSYDLEDNIWLKIV